MAIEDLDYSQSTIIYLNGPREAARVGLDGFDKSILNVLVTKITVVGTVAK